jgi:Ala-tRNA(Pro) deacylase
VVRAFGIGYGLCTKPARSFGDLYGVKVLVDEALTENQEIAFNAGSHRELMRMACHAYESLVKPTMAQCAYKPL